MSVREARFNFARALAQEETAHDEAERQLRRALEEPGEVPADWEVRQALADLRLADGDHTGALRNLVRAVLHAPPGAGDAPAHEALSLLRSTEGRAAAYRLGEQFIKDLTRKGAAASGTAVPRLAAKLALLRNDLGGVQPVAEDTFPIPVSSTATPGDAEEPTELVAAAQAARVNHLLRGGRAEEALEVVVELLATGDVGRGELASLHGLALYAVGDPDGALETLQEAGSDPLAPVVATLAKLHKAAGVTGTERDQWLDEALSDAATAARLDPRSGELLLLRAQVLVETGLELEHAHELLQRGQAKVYGSVDDVLWYAVERGVRSDSFFTCFVAEVAALQGERGWLQDLTARLPLPGLAEAQSSTLWRRVAEAWEPEDPERAREAYLASAEAIRGLDADAAVVAAEHGYRLSPTPVAAVSLVEYLWASTFATQSGAREDAPARLARARELLEGAEASVPEDELGRANLLRGLLEVRRHELDEPEADLWVALPSLLLGAALMPWNGYAAAHVSTCLEYLDLAGSAFRYARAAHALVAYDPWVDERLVVTRMNWFGQLDDECWQLLQQVDDAAWRDAVMLVHHLLGGSPQQVTALGTSDGTPLDGTRLDSAALWMHEARAYADLFSRGPAAARTSLVRFAERARQDGDPQVVLEATVLVGGDVTDDLVVSGPTTFQHSAAAAAAQLLDSDGTRGTDELAAAIDAMRRPFQLRKTTRFLQALTVAHPERSGAVRALHAMVARATARTERVDTSPTLEADVELLAPGERAAPVVAAALRLLALLLDAAGDGARPGPGPQTTRAEVDRLSGPESALAVSAVRGLEVWASQVELDTGAERRTADPSTSP